VLIRPMLPADLDAVILATRDVGWGDLRPHFQFYLDRPECYPFVAEIAGRVVGTAAGTRKGNAGWIGHVIVQAEYRRRGIGAALVEATIARLEAVGCATQLLVATDLGRPVYEKLGFREDSRYSQCRGATLDEFPTHAGLRSLEKGDLPAIFALDRQATGEDRSAQIRAFAARGWVFAGDRPGEVRGFYLPTPWAEGPVIASDPEAAGALIDVARADARLLRGAAEMRIKLPAANRAGRDVLHDRGFDEGPLRARMIRGEAIDWRPDLIYARFSGALG
jgi:GNAT superfamily N-acetyltransferase